MIDSSNQLTSKLRIKNSFLITIILAIFLITTFALFPLPAQALSTSKSVDVSADLNRVYQDFGNSEKRILIARRGITKGSKVKNRRKPSKNTSGRSRRKSKKSIIDIGVELAKLVWKSAEHHAKHDAKLARHKAIRGRVF